MKHVRQVVLLTVLLFVAVALLETALKIGAQLAPFIAGTRGDLFDRTALGDG